MTGIAAGVSASNGALLVGGLVLLGATTLFMMGRKEQTKVAYAAQSVSQEGVEDMIFASVLDSADRPETVLKNEDRVREYIRRQKSMVSDLIKQYTEGRLDYQELRQEVLAISLEVNESLNIPARPGAERKAHPSYENYPAKYGHRNKRMQQKMINHGSLPRGTGDCDCLPTTTQMMANAYPAHKVGFGKKKDDDWEPPGFNKGWELGRGNPHDDNTIPLVPKIPPGNHYGWEKGVGNPHGIVPTSTVGWKDKTHGQNSLPHAWGRKRKRFNNHKLADAVITGPPIAFPGHGVYRGKGNPVWLR